MLGLHGHVPESNGVVRLGKTVCINPGSEAEDGALHGVLVVLDGERVKGHILTNT